MSTGQLDPAVEQERNRCLQCVESCLDLPIQDPFTLAILYKLSTMIGTGMQAGESPAVDFPDTRPLDDTDPVYL
jgi:hypothetical protein